MAGGFTIKIENFDKFKKFIFKKFKNINNISDKEKPLYLDSVIAPTALNLEFYNKVNVLSTFWIRQSRTKVCYRKYEIC